MLFDLFVLGIGASCLLALINWRWGVRLALVVGVLQDPVRKLTLGTPAIMAISALPVWIAASIGLLRRDEQAWARLARAYPRLGRRLRIFMLCLIPPTLVVFGYGLDAWRAALLGLFAYLAPLVTLVGGFSFARDAADVRRLLTFYAVFTAFVLVGTPLEQAGLGGDAVGTQVLGTVWMRYPDGGEPFPLLSGFFRSPDLLGWHAATLVLVSVTLALASPRALGRLWLLATVWASYSLVLAGRRKMIVMPFVWLAVLVLSYLRTRRVRGVVSAGPIVGVAALGVWLLSGEGRIQGDYFDYASSTIADAPARFAQGTVQALWTTWLQSGALGRGLGSATQGAQHLVSSSGQSWQESGASKLLVELGLPGFLCALFVIAAVVQGCRAALAQVSLARPEGLTETALVGILAANAVSFIVSHQAYGDLVVASLSAFLVGVALSGPRWCGQRAALPNPLRAPAARKREPPVPA